MIKNDINQPLIAHLTEIEIHKLGTKTRRLIALIGLPETIKLLQARGGAPFFIPKHSDKTRTLQDILLPESIKKLSKSEMSNKIISLPKADKMLQQVRDIYITSQRGLISRRQLAKQFNITTRHVLNIWLKNPLETEEKKSEQQAQQTLL